MEEIWKDIQGYEGYYQVSNLGRVKSLDRIIYQNKNNVIYSRTIKGRLLKFNNDKQGYQLVHLDKEGKRLCKKVHRLVAEAFIKNKNNKVYVNHIDGNKKNNNITNLEWVTATENNLHAYKTKLSKPKSNMLGRLGKDNPCSKIIYQIDKTTNQIIKQYYGSYEAERCTGIYSSNIISCCNGKVKTAGGYIWKYKE
jgi:hypothetical protein